MTAADRFWLAAQRRVGTLQPDVQRALLKAFDHLRASFTDAEIVRLIESGAIATLFAEVLNQGTMDRAFLQFRAQLRQTTERGFAFAVRDLPRGGKVGGVVGVAFDHLSPDVITAIRQLETKAIRTLQSDVRDVVLAHVENGIRDGKNPRVIARSLRDVIGMSPTQQANAEKFRAKMAAKGLSGDKLEKAVAAYQRRAIALNAETNARTATLDAYKAGQQLAWQNAIDQGIVDADRLVKSWKGVMDERERLEHVAMQGETVPFDEPYSNGEQVPGESTYNCRCVSIVRVAPAPRSETPGASHRPKVSASDALVV